MKNEDPEIITRTTQVSINAYFYPRGESRREGNIWGVELGCPLFIGTEAFDVRIYLGGRVLELGGTYDVDVAFLSPHIAIPLLAVGSEVRFWEGGHRRRKSHRYCREEIPHAEASVIVVKSCTDQGASPPMNTAIRAHRILVPMPNYRRAEPTDEWFRTLVSGRLGEPVGRYMNTGPAGRAVGVFSDGLAWLDGACLIELRFADVADVSLPNGKVSEGLLLSLRNGKQVELPINGHRGKIFDSMEMLRFLTRVIADLHRTARPA